MVSYNHPKPGQVEAVTTFVLGRDALYSPRSMTPINGKPDINVCTIKLILSHCARALNAGAGGESNLEISSWLRTPRVVTPVWGENAEIIMKE